MRRKVARSVIRRMDEPNRREKETLALLGGETVKKKKNKKEGGRPQITRDHLAAIAKSPLERSYWTAQAKRRESRLALSLPPPLAQRRMKWLLSSFLGLSNYSAGLEDGVL